MPANTAQRDQPSREQRPDLPHRHAENGASRDPDGSKHESSSVGASAELLVLVRSDHDLAVAA
jgi:hypothetical protein